MPRPDATAGLGVCMGVLAMGCGVADVGMRLRWWGQGVKVSGEMRRWEVEVLS